MTATSLDLSQIKTDALSSAATFRTLIGLGSSDAVTFKEATLTSGTVTSSTPVINATQTWNDGATTFTGFKLNVTNTSSATASKLIDLQINGSTQFSVTKAGQVVSYDITLGSNGGVNGTGNRLPLRLGVQDYLWVTSAGARIRSDGAYSFTNGAIDGGTIDLSIYRDAANTLAQRNGTNAQTFRLYNTYTSSTSYERGFMRWNSNVLEIGTEAGSGGGSNRAISFVTFATARWQINTDGHLLGLVHRGYDLGGASNRCRTVYTKDFNGEGFVQLSEMGGAPTTPAVNTCRIYAKDNGSGKTQLVVLMPDGIETVLATET